jgi:peptide deformylase
MALLKVLLWPDPTLRLVSDPVPFEWVKSEEFQQLVKDMTETLLHYRGVGLSAIQVGVQDQLFVMRTRQGVQAFVNPRIIERDGEPTQMEEGCLSIPGYTQQVYRFPNVIVEAMDFATGEPRNWDLEGIEAQCAQHELEHLEGRLFSDNWGRVTKDIVRRKIAKARRLDPRYKE